MSHDNNPQGDDAELSRRTWMQVLGATGAAGLAGCLGGDDADDDAGGDDSDLEEPRPMVRTRTDGVIPEDMNWNPFADIVGFPTDWMTDREAVLPANGELWLIALDDWYWDADSNTLGRVYRDDLTFWNGDQYTAEDAYVYDELLRVRDPEVSEYEAIEQVDDLTVEYVFKEPRNAQILRGTHLTDNLLYRKDVWRPWLEQFQDASDQDERDNITANELVDLTISIDEVIDEGLGTGTYQLVNYDEQTTYYEPAEAHRHYEDVEIVSFEIKHVGDEVRDQMTVNGDVDMATRPLAERFEGSAPEYLENIVYRPTKYTHKLMINQLNHEDLQERNVRRAMACVIDNELCASNAGQVLHNPVYVHSGMDDGSNEEFIDDIVGDFLDYGGGNADYDAADTYLEGAGYSREDGTIYRPDGEEMEPITFLNQDSFHQVGAETAGLQLEEYGFPMETNTIERQRALQIYQEEMSEWDIGVESHYADATNHPYRFFVYNSFWGWRIVQSGFGPAEGAEQQVQQWLEDGEERSPFIGKELIPEIPTDVGSADLDGSTEDLNIYEITKEIEGGASPERTTELIRKLSWAWNFHVPDLQTVAWMGGAWGNTRDFDWPVDDERMKANNGPYPMIKNGEVTYSDRFRSP